LEKETLTFSLEARSFGSENAAFSRATQDSRSEMVSGRVYGCRLVGAPLWTCWSRGMITKLRGSVVGLMGEPEAILLGDSVRVIGGDMSFSLKRSCSRSRGIV
jgi:hypothetical protein